MTQCAPAAMALVMSPEYRIPPSAMMGTSECLAASAASKMAVTWGTPTPEITRVVQIDPGSNAHLHRVRASGQQVLASFLGCHVSRNDINVPPSLDFADCLQHIRRMAVSTVHNQNVNTFLDQALRSIVVEYSDRRSHPQPAQLIFAGLGEPFHHVNVFDRDESGQFV